MRTLSLVAAKTTLDPSVFVVEFRGSEVLSMIRFTRRMVLKLMTLSAALARPSGRSRAAATSAGSHTSNWHNTHDRIWLGAAYWANPMEDWRVVRGSAECQTTGGDRNIHLVTHQLTDADSTFQMTVSIEGVEVKRIDGGAGFRIGIQSDINEHRSNCFARNGINAGLAANRLFLGRQTKTFEPSSSASEFLLELSGQPNGVQYELTLTVKSADAMSILAQIRETVPAATILGNVALVNNFDSAIKKGNGARYRFRDWSVSGDAFTVTPAHEFGPVLWSMYTLSDSRSQEGFVLKVSALTGPLGDQDNKAIELQIQTVGQWKPIDTAQLDHDAWTATFRIPRWDQTSSTPYRLVYRENHVDGDETESHWSGTIRRNPEGRPLRLAALTCQKDYAFPYEPVANNLLKVDPDLLYFSGDQLYEDHGGYGLIRDPAEPAILNYLRKFYMFGWAFRNALKDRPTLCIPDDHDVFQGNIWGEGGAKMANISGGASSKGGYREPARMVNVVHRTCAGHHPEAHDRTPCKQDISVYYGEVVYGGVGFAILGDRQWKSGPERVETGSGRADHVLDPNFDTSVLDRPELDLLGKRQEKFLEAWSDDWRGHTMKVLLSQTVFAGVATHHGRYNGFLKADLDSGGWPQTARNRAISILRKSMALHINGDQHLTSLVQYGVKQQRDGNWSFCTPAIAAGYPRWWRPDEVGMKFANRPDHGLPETGEYLDGFGNRAYVYAVGYSEVGSKKNRYDLAHQKGSGFGMVTIDTAARTYKLEAFRSGRSDGRESVQPVSWLAGHAAPTGKWRSELAKLAWNRVQD
jgi:hypothetical protein